MLNSIFSIPKLAACLVIVALATAFALQAHAQERVRRAPIKQQTTTKPALQLKVNRIEQADGGGLPVIAPKASRTQIDPPSLQLDAGPAAKAKPPAPLTNANKVTLIKGASGGDAGGGNFNAPDNSLQTVTLTARNPYAHNKAYIAFADAEYVHAGSGSAGSVTFEKDGPGEDPHLWISTNTVKGNRYLVDLHVYSTRNQSYTVVHEGGEQSFDEKAGGNHVLFILEPKGTGYVAFTLRSTSGFRFYAAEISKL